MLQRVNIENIALIDRLEIELAEGFNVLTGETGAGKSIIIDALGLILGERSSKELITHGEQRARVEAEFLLSENSNARKYLLENELDCSEDYLTVSREIFVSGRNVCRVNGTLVSTAMLKELTSHLVDVHGQHEHQSLIMPSKHIDYLDAFGGESIASLKKETAAKYHEYKQIAKELQSGFMSEDERMRRIDILGYQVREINAAGLFNGEEEALKEEQEVLNNSETIINALNYANEMLNGEQSQAVSAVKTALKQLESIASIAGHYSEVSERLADAYYSLEDVARTVSDMRADAEHNPGRLDEIGARLYTIANLKKKYGGSVEAVIAFGNAAEAELMQLECADERRDALIKRLNNAEIEYRKIAGELTEARKNAAKALEPMVVRHLSDLGLVNSEFCVEFTTAEEISESGTDKVIFLLTTNKGEPPKQLNKVASGGELSRIMLALKTIIAGEDDIPTLIFDEIDVGVSGRISAMVGEKMHRIANSRQVICITHSPQIAAYAEGHFLVEKRDFGDRMRTNVRRLTMDEHIDEVARIMGTGAESDLARRHAEELITVSRSRTV